MSVLREMFPDIREEAIRQLRIDRAMSMNAVDTLVSEQEKRSKPATVPSLLHSLSRSVFVDPEDTYEIRVNRHCIFNKAEVFYKRAMHDRSLFHKTLAITVSGEEGIDLEPSDVSFSKQQLERQRASTLRENLKSVYLLLRGAMKSIWS